MNYFLPYLCFIFMSLLFASCTSNSNKPDEEVDQEAAVEQAPPRPTRNILTTAEFIALSACHDLPCVQLFMKDLSADFIHAKKGEFASQSRSVVTDTTGDSLDIPMSTLYVTVDAGADWRMAHTLHNKALSDQLLQEFAAEKFLLSDSLYSKKNEGYTHHYRSEQYPGLVLSHLKTFEPWHARGLYYTVTWPCYVFELSAAE
jgi:hypothetical protein